MLWSSIHLASVFGTLGLLVMRGRDRGHAPDRLTAM